MSKVNNIEYRILDPEVAEYRLIEESGKRFLEGHAAVFNQKSKLIFEDGKIFNEIISPNAFDEELKSNRDVLATVNHERGNLLGRTKSKTLGLSIDEKGLKFRVEIPNTTIGNDVYTLIQRGDLFENSFAFVVGSDSWSKDENGNDIRTINSIKKLVDVSIVTNGAYSNTDIAARSLDSRYKPDPTDEELTSIFKDIESLADYPWDQCIADQKAKGYSDESATKICAYIKNKNNELKVKTEIEHMRMRIKELKLKNNNI